MCAGLWTSWFDQTTDTRPVKVLNIIDEYSRESLCISASRSIDARGVLAHLDDLVATAGAPKYLRVDNGPEFIAHALSDLLEELGVTLWFTIPGSPWQNGKVESSGGRLRDEMLNGELFESIAEAQLRLDRWQAEYNEYRPHSSLGYLSPREFVALPLSEQRRRLRTAKRRPRAWWEVRELREQAIAA